LEEARKKGQRMTKGMKERNNKINTESFSEAVVLDPPSN
jgi:hypothetical protein